MMQVQVVILLALAAVGYTFPSGMCEADTCQNGGTCLDMGSMYMCVCSDQYLGEHCERSAGETSRVIGLTADPCTPNPCQNGGLCFTRDSAGTSGVLYHCSCLRPYGGLHCDVALVEARLSSPCDANPCRNGGACEESATTDGGYVCRCTDDWRGSNCETLPCDMYPCLNGGDCFTGYRYKGRYLCRCDPGYKGKNCEIGDPCMNSPCGQGNLCLPNREDNTFSCMCPCSPGSTCQNQPSTGGDGTDNSGNTDGDSGKTDGDSGSSGSGSDSGNSGSGTGNNDNTLSQTGNGGYNSAIGHRCDMMMRESYNCSNHGVCSYDGDRDIVICTCDAGYSGDICQHGNGASGSDSGSSGSNSGSSGSDSGSSGSNSGSSGSNSGSSGGQTGGTDEDTLAQTGDGSDSQVSDQSDESRCTRMMRETNECSNGHGYCRIDSVRDIAICRCYDGYSGDRCQNVE